MDRGFILSDHADWPGLQTAVAATGAQRVFVTHGQVHPMVRWLREKGLDAQVFSTEYGEEEARDAALDASLDASPENTNAGLGKSPSSTVQSA